MNAKILQSYFLVALIAISSIVAFFIFRPFIPILVLSAVFAVVFQPLHRRILSRMSGLPGLAAFATMLVSVICILVPLTFITIQIVGEAEYVYSSLSSGGETYLDTALQYVANTASHYIPGLTLSGAEISTFIEQHMKDGLAWVIQNLGGAFQGITQLLFSSLIFLFALYYFLRDGAKLRRTILKASFLAETDTQMLFTRLETAINSIVRGSLTIVLIQGVLTGIGFTLFGVPNGVLWGVAAALCALIPGFGTSLVLVPGIIYLFIIGSTTPAIGLLIWSLLAVGIIDNLLGPRLMGKGMQLHPLIVLLSVLGGLAFFGPVGAFMGPLCTSLLFALLSIYQND